MLLIKHIQQFRPPPNLPSGPVGHASCAVQHLSRLRDYTETTQRALVVAPPQPWRNSSEFDAPYPLRTHAGTGLRLKFWVAQWLFGRQCIRVCVCVSVHSHIENIPGKNIILIIIITYEGDDLKLSEYTRSAGGGAFLITNNRPRGRSQRSAGFTELIDFFLSSSDSVL